MKSNSNIIRNKPLFTIITATYNAEKFLESTIESIKTQKFKLFEWIIIDSCSTDKTPNIIEENILLFDLYISEKDKGIYDAWNKGIIYSSGQWIAFIGAGDILLDNALEDYADLIKSTDKSIGYNFICSKSMIIDSDHSQLKIIGMEYISREFIKFMSISHVASMHHKSLFDEFGLYSQNFRSSSDYEFLLRCKDSIKPLFLDKITVKMLAGGISDSYRAVYETYIIHKEYHPKFIAQYYFIIAVIKLFIRKNLMKL
jgi:glycosyltransferase involved in cell wall biosynthesis